MLHKHRVHPFVSLGCFSDESHRFIHWWVWQKSDGGRVIMSSKRCWLVKNNTRRVTRSYCTPCHGPDLEASQFCIIRIIYLFISLFWFELTSQKWSVGWDTQSKPANHKPQSTQEHLFIRKYIYIYMKYMYVLIIKTWVIRHTCEAV